MSGPAASNRRRAAAADASVRQQKREFRVVVTEEADIGVSVLHCMTVSLAEGGTGLGTAWGEQTARQFLAQAGFTSVEAVDAPGPQSAHSAAGSGCSRAAAVQGHTSRSHSSTSAKSATAMAASSSMAAKARFDLQYEVAETIT